ncbi:hypothetical protein EU537_07390 [Candidatus Thorarchaeota archaeon]|nr:MAG: hypothetical protein EU537_07390 [Candidatus Thorarchaeota archaeon]
MQDVMMTISMPSVLALGYLIALIFFILGFREDQDFVKKSRMYGYASVTFGLMLIITIVSWFGSLAAFSGQVPMYLSDIILLSGISFIAGMSMLYGIQRATI